MTEEESLIDWLASVTNDPVAFAYGAFPWGEEGTALENHTLEDWQLKVLELLKAGLIDLQTAIRIARTSGHGIGKSALVSIVILWAFTTFTDCRGVVTANTENQLRTKTWAELGKWFNLFIGREMFTLTATSLLSKDKSRERTWRIDATPWSEKNTEAFAGLHNQGRRLLLIMDEASAIPDVIHEVAEGALTDANTQIIWLMFGNPTRSTGRFKEAFAGGRFSAMWNSTNIDARSVSFTNKADLNAKIAAYGEDSDYVRIRITGQFPRTGEMEFFSAAEVDAAMAREAPYTDTHTPLALGVDVARFGKNASVLFYRKGRDARSIARETYRGLSTVELATKVHDAFNTFRPDGIFIDGGGVGGGVVDNCRNQHLFCYDIQFGGKDDAGSAWAMQGEKYANKRAGMYGAARAWMKTGALPPDPDLRTQLLGITYYLNIRDEIILTSKEDMADAGLPSPDDADAFVLTFAYPIAAHAGSGGDYPHTPIVESEYDPYSPERMAS